jgi:hypothetical protein
MVYGLEGAAGGDCGHQLGALGPAGHPRNREIAECRPPVAASSPDSAKFAASRRTTRQPIPLLLVCYARGSREAGTCPAPAGRSRRTHSPFARGFCDAMLEKDQGEYRAN